MAEKQCNLIKNGGGMDNKKVVSVNKSVSLSFNNSEISSQFSINVLSENFSQILSVTGQGPSYDIIIVGIARSGNVITGYGYRLSGPITVTTNGTLTILGYK